MELDLGGPEWDIVRGGDVCGICNVDVELMKRWVEMTDDCSDL